MNPLFRDPYKVLGIASNATEREIRRAYRRLAMKYHPDRNPDDPVAGEKFKEVQWAYETLTGTKKTVSAPLRQGQYETPLSEEVDPFMNFFQAVRAHYAKKKDSPRNG